MGLRRWDPFRELEALQENINRLFQDRFLAPTTPAADVVWAPNVDVIEDENQIIVRAELPGMKKEDIDIEFTGDTLTIKGERKFENEEKKDNFVRIETAYGQFQRSFTVGVPVKANEIKAAYKDGILEVTLPKAEEVKPKKIDVAIEE